MTILKSRARSYLDVNAFDLTGLRANLNASGNETFLETFRLELASTIEGTGLSRVEYQKLTNDDFDEDADFVAYMKGVYAYLFEDAPHP